MVLTITKNLISNAIKFNREGGSVRIAAHHDGSTFIFSVADEGIGIAPEEMPQLFHKFYRSRSVSESGIQGTGLGLTLVKEAVEAHGGTVEVESDPGVGTRFTVRIPEEQPDEPGAQALGTPSKVSPMSQENHSGEA
jgi:two-component system sensor histidine kinase BaeS